MDEPSVATGTPIEATGPNGAIVDYTTPSAVDATVTCVKPSGSEFRIGVSYVTCTATDGVWSSECTFPVVVVDTTAPNVTCPIDMKNTSAIGNYAAGGAWEATSPGGAVVTYDPPITSDLVDENVEVTCDPPSGSIFEIGSTYVTCTAVDDSGNNTYDKILENECDFEVVVVDSTPPEIKCPVNMTTPEGVKPISEPVEATGPDGAPIEYELPEVNDDATYDDDITIDCTPPSGHVFPIGETEVTCTATDGVGLSSMCKFDVIVEDTTPPDLTCPVDVEGIAISKEATTLTGANVDYTISATDKVDENVDIVCAPVSGSFFNIGEHPIQCTATDDYGNSATCPFNVEVTPKCGNAIINEEDPFLEECDGGNLCTDQCKCPVDTEPNLSSLPGCECCEPTLTNCPSSDITWTNCAAGVDIPAASIYGVNATNGCTADGDGRDLEAKLSCSYNTETSEQHDILVVTRKWSVETASPCKATAFCEQKIHIHCPPEAEGRRLLRSFLAEDETNDWSAHL